MFLHPSSLSVFNWYKVQGEIYDEPHFLSVSQHVTCYCSYLNLVMTVSMLVMAKLLIFTRDTQLRSSCRCETTIL